MAHRWHLCRLRESCWCPVALKLSDSTRSRSCCRILFRGALSGCPLSLQWLVRAPADQNPGAYELVHTRILVRAVEGEAETVKLAEALAERAEATRRAEQLRARVISSARYQEGETPAENAAQLLAEAGEVLNALETLIRRINRTNATVEMGPDGTLTDALARRDVLRLRHSVVTSAADAAAGKGDRGYGRQLRSELMMLSALPVAELRGQADELAREIREIDVRIQRRNWEADLLD